MCVHSCPWDWHLSASLVPNWGLGWKNVLGSSQHCRIESFKGAPNWGPIMLRDARLSLPDCKTPPIRPIAVRETGVSNFHGRPIECPPWNHPYFTILSYCSNLFDQYWCFVNNLICLKASVLLRACIFYNTMYYFNEILCSYVTFIQ